jgi:tRNA threonylcarbamoyl adenosine modification protein YjeE
MEKAITTLRDLEAEAARFVRELSPSLEGATLVTLSGELGAGKTAFSKAIAKELGVTEVVTSPTFVLEKIYMLPSGGVFENLIHIDAYRLESGADLAPLGFDEVMRGAKNLVLLEWPEKVADALPKASVHISIALQPDGSRVFTYG